MQRTLERIPTWPIIVPIHIPMNIGLVNSPSTTLRWPCIFRELISLNRVIMTNVLNTIVKCTVEPGQSRLIPDSISNHSAPGKYCQQRWNTEEWKYGRNIRIWNSQNYLNIAKTGTHQYWWLYSTFKLLQKFSFTPLFVHYFTGNMKTDYYSFSPLWSIKEILIGRTEVCDAGWGFQGYGSSLGQPQANVAVGRGK